MKKWNFSQTKHTTSSLKAALRLLLCVMVAQDAVASEAVARPTMPTMKSRLLLAVGLVVGLNLWFPWGQVEEAAVVPRL